MSNSYDSFYIIGRNNALALMQQADSLTPHEICEQEVLIPNWKPRNWQKVGQPCKHQGQDYKVLQAHDSTENADWFPNGNSALFEVLHTKNPERAKSWVAPNGTSGVYQKGEVYTENGVIYRSKVDNNVYKFEEYQENWEVV